MRNKEVEDRIRKSIDIESRDFLDKLLEYPVEKRRKKSKLKYIKWGVNFGSVCVFIFALFLTKNMWNRDQKLSPTEPPSIVDHIQFNEVVYNKGEVDKNDDNNRDTLSRVKDLSYINLQFNLNIEENLFEQYDRDILCYFYESNNQISQCNILLSKNDYQSRIQIGLKKQDLPIFNNEVVNMWEQQDNFDNYIKSQIGIKEVILVKNTVDNLKDYKTKFKINDLGIAVDSYEIEEEAFIDMIKVIIDNFK